MLVVGVTLTAAWPEGGTSHLPDTTRLALPTTDPPDGAVEIVGVEAGALWTDAQPATVAISVRNNDDEPVRAEVWWLLATPGVAKPWVDPGDRGRPERVTLEAGASETVLVESAGAPPVGVWSLSLWAHELDGRRRVHSHGAGAAPWVNVVSTGTGLVRLAEPGGRAVIHSVRPGSRLGGSPAVSGGDVEVALQATVQDPAVVQVRCFLTDRPEAEPWLDGDAVVSGMKELLLDGPVVRTASCAFDELPTHGRWTLSAVAWRQAGFVPGDPEDGVRAEAPVTIGAAQDPTSAPVGSK